MTRTALDRVVKQSVKTLAAIADPLFGSLRGPRLLVYHQIDAGLGREMEVTLDAFASQIEWLQTNAEVVIASKRRGIVAQSQTRTGWRC